MLSNSERRVFLFIISVLLLGSITGYLQPEVEPEKNTKSSFSFPININSATKENLTLLPGIGKIIAKRILEYRAKNNGFKTKEEIVKVKGIGKVKFEKIKDKICVETSDKDKQ